MLIGVGSVQVRDITVTLRSWPSEVDQQQSIFPILTIPLRRAYPHQTHWPKPLPDNWILGQVAGIATDSKDHIRVLLRPRSVTEVDTGKRAQRFMRVQ